jgi:hypothetical protein
VIAAIRASRPVRWLVGAFATILAVLAYGWRQRAVGAAQARDGVDVKSARESVETFERMHNAPVTLEPDIARERLLNRDPDTR